MPDTDLTVLVATYERPLWLEAAVRSIQRSAASAERDGDPVSDHALQRRATCRSAWDPSLETAWPHGAGPELLYRRARELFAAPARAAHRAVAR